MKLSPPNLIDLKIFDRDKFTKTLPVPTITFSEQHSKDMKEIVKNLKKYFIKVEKFRPVTGDKIYLNPDVVQSWDDITSEALESLNITEASLKFENVEFTYQNWRADELVKAIIPDGVEPVTSYSKIGHVIHLNLKDHLLPYKNHIAQIFMDKSPGCRTVINKAQSIDNTFRNFQIELLAGEADYQVETKENGSTFEFDFSTVYWNPRLCGEHERLVKLLNPNDVLLDVFAGVGPFAVPAGKKRVNVFANDLNPHSFQWLQHNVKRNKVTNYVKTFKKDGREFILNDVKDQLLERIEKRDEDMKEYAIHITMNLPALAVTFIDAFVGLLKDFKGTITIPTPICHCYCFVKGVEDSKVMAKQLVEEHLGFPLTDETLQGIQFVRNVAPNKDMIRVDLLLTPDVLLGNVTARDSPAPDDFIPNKKICNSVSSSVTKPLSTFLFSSIGIRDGQEQEDPKDQPEVGQQQQ